MHEVQDRGNIVDDVKITLPISSSGSDGGAVWRHYRVIFKRSINSAFILGWSANIMASQLYDTYERSGYRIDTFPQVNSMIRMYMFYVCIWGSHWGSHRGSHGGSHGGSHVSLECSWGHKRAQGSKIGFVGVTKESCGLSLGELFCEVDSRLCRTALWKGS